MIPDLEEQWIGNKRWLHIIIISSVTLVIVLAILVMILTSGGYEG